MNVRYQIQFAIVLAGMLVLSCLAHADGRGPSLRPQRPTGREVYPPRSDVPSSSGANPSRPPIKLDRTGSDDQIPNRNDSSSSSGQLGTTLAALAFVVLLIVVVAKLMKKHSPMLAGSLPTEALDILGRRYIDQRHSILLIRCGSKLLVVGLTPDGMNTLSEIDDPAEVDLLAGLSRTNNNDKSFSQLFMQNRSQQLAKRQIRPATVSSQYQPPVTQTTVPESAPRVPATGRAPTGPPST